MEYKKILTVLKRYSFESKMSISYYFSHLMMDFDGMKIAKYATQGYPLPWELETFTMLSVHAQEWNNKLFSGVYDKQFFSIINAIRSFLPPKLDLVQDAQIKRDHLLMLIRLTQFELQKSPFLVIYRYWYIFNFNNSEIDMPAIFRAKYSCDYDDFAIMALSLWNYFSIPNAGFNQDLWTHLCEKWEKPLQALIISRKQFTEELNKTTTDISDYIYCLRPSYSYPFISDKEKVFLPLPHSIIQACTSSLLFRLTNNNNKLQEKIGKHILEQYLFELVQELNFDEVIPEQTYKDGRIEGNRTTDIMARRGQYAVFFDSKSFSPKRDIRTLNEQAIDGDYKRLSKCFVQMYKHLFGLFQTKYNFFSDQQEISKDNRFGLVIVKESAYFREKTIYERAAEELGIIQSSNEYHWLCKHIGMVDLFEIERFCVFHADILNSLLNHENQTEFYPWLAEDFEQCTVQYSKYDAFCDKIQNYTVQAMKEVFS